MKGLWDFIAGPATSLVDSVGGVIDNLHTSDDEKNEAKRKLAQIERGFYGQVVEADTEWVKAQASVIQAEANSQSWLARNWRPILMLVFTYIIAHNFVIAPMFSIEAVEIPPNMWDLIKIGIGGYVIGRTTEKILPQSKWAKDV